MVLFGKTTGVGVETFHKLARDWAKLDVSLDHLTTIDRSGMPGWMLHLIDQVLEWGLKALEENKYYQSDYKELLELRFCHGFQVQVRHFTIWVLGYFWDPFLISI